MKDKELEILEDLKIHFNARAKDWQGFVYSGDNIDNDIKKVAEKTAVVKATADLANNIIDVASIENKVYLTGSEMNGIRVLLTDQYNYCKDCVKFLGSSQAFAAVAGVLVKMGRGSNSFAEKPVTKTVIKYPL